MVIKVDTNYIDIARVHPELLGIMNE